MSINRATESARQFQSRQRRMLRRMAPSLAGRGVVVMIATVFEMLDSPFSEAAARFLALAYASATGNAEPQECFVCCEPWAPTRAPVLLGHAEIVKKPGRPRRHHALWFAICSECCANQAAIAAALRRDFGETRLICSEAGTA